MFLEHTDFLIKNFFLEIVLQLCELLQGITVFYRQHWTSLSDLGASVLPSKYLRNLRTGFIKILKYKALWKDLFNSLGIKALGH